MSLHKSLVRPDVEYCALMWKMHLLKDITAHPSTFYLASEREMVDVMDFLHAIAVLLDFEQLACAMGRNVH